MRAKGVWNPPKGEGVDINVYPAYTRTGSIIERARLRPLTAGDHE
jgi:hypothetical protein